MARPVRRAQFFYALPLYVFLLNFLLSFTFASPLGDLNVQRISRGSTVTIRTDIFNSSSLEKRGPCVSKLCCLSGDGDEWQCTKGWPSLAELISQVQNYGNVGTKTSLFYTSLGGINAIGTIKQWACNPENGIPNPPGYVAFDEIVDPDWQVAQAQAILDTFGPSTNIDPFPKLLSQAFAAASKGDVYLFVPYNVDPLNPIPDAYHKTAWAGWEYPQLTRNPDVTTIYRVDPTSSAPDNNPTAIWNQGDGPSELPPLGLYFPPS